ncbi:MAG: class I tRNA ligase family protein, partial [Trichodesmium sp. St11_bin5]|nr:class I tRNA ligase family protein [Trichodesmium sp. St11_bin5]
AKGLYEFIWGYFCDWYLELVKSRLQGEDENSRLVAQQTLAYVLDGILRLLHPFMPHITEEIWHTLNQVGEENCLALQSYPKLDKSLINSDLEHEFELLIGVIRSLRNLRAEVDIKPKVKITAILQSQNEQEREILRKGENYIQDLIKIEKLNITSSVDLKVGQTIAGVIGTVQVLIPLSGVVDIEALSARLNKKLEKLEKEIGSTKKRLSKPDFVKKADPKFVEETRNNLAEAEKQAEFLRDRLDQFQSN